MPVYFYFQNLFLIERKITVALEYMKFGIQVYFPQNLEIYGEHCVNTLFHWMVFNRFEIPGRGCRHACINFCLILHKMFHRIQ